MMKGKTDAKSILIEEAKDLEGAKEEPPKKVKEYLFKELSTAVKNISDMINAFIQKTRTDNNDKYFSRQKRSIELVEEARWRRLMCHFITRRFKK